MPTQSVKACPFCGALPRRFAGSYIVCHSMFCFFYIREPETWLVGRRVDAWNMRPENARKANKNENTRDVGTHTL